MLSLLSTQYFFIPVCRGAMFIMIAFAGTATAQSTTGDSASRCSSEASSIARDMDVARSKGQMLRHRQLADQRVVLLKNCPLVGSSESFADRIKHLERRVIQLTGELAEVEAELERLRKAP